MKKILPPTSFVGLVRLLRTRNIITNLYSSTPSRMSHPWGGVKPFIMVLGLGLCRVLCPVVRFVFFACCVYSLSLCLFLSLARALFFFSLSSFPSPFFPLQLQFSFVFHSSLNSFCCFFFLVPLLELFFSFFLFLFHPTGRLFPRLEFGVAALRKISLLWGTLYLLRSLVRLGFLVSFFIVFVNIFRFFNKSLRKKESV